MAITNKGILSNPEADSLENSQEEFDGLIDKIVAAIERMPHGNPASVPDAEWLVIQAMGIVRYSPFIQEAALDRQQYAQSREWVGEASTRREIDTVRKAALKLDMALKALHWPARKALQLTIESMPGEVLIEPDTQIELALVMLVRRTEHFDIPSMPKNPGRGRKKINQEAVFTDWLAKTYASHTGKRPTVPSKEGKRYGPFLTFVKDIFDIFNIKASPDAQAMEAAERFKQEIVRKKGQ